MEQAIRVFKSAHAAKVACDQLVKDLWAEYQTLDEDNVKGKKKILKRRSVAVVRSGNLSQKSNIAETKMIKAILESDFDMVDALTTWVKS